MEKERFFRLFLITALLALFLILLGFWVEPRLDILFSIPEEDLLEQELELIAGSVFE